MLNQKLQELISKFKFEFSYKDMIGGIVGVFILLALGGNIFLLGSNLSFDYNFEYRHQYLANQAASKVKTVCENNHCYHEINSLPLTLSWKLPTDYAKGEIDLIYKPAKDANLSVTLTNKQQTYTLENSSLQKILDDPGYTVLQNNNYYLIQKKANYHSWQDFLANPPTTGTIGILGLRLSTLKQDISKTTPPAISLVTSDTFNQDIYFKKINDKPITFNVTEQPGNQNSIFYITDTQKNIIHRQTLQLGTITIANAAISPDQVYRLHWDNNEVKEIVCQGENLVCESLASPEGQLANQYYRTQTDEQIVDITNLNDDQINALDYILAYYDPPRILDTGWHKKTIIINYPTENEMFSITSTDSTQPILIDQMNFRFTQGQINNFLMSWFNQATKKLEANY